MIVLSLFDWISCARVALERAWIKVDAYYASEIDKYAIKVSQKNRDDVYHIGNVKDVSWLCWMLKTPRWFWQINSEPKTEDWIWISKIELLIWWSPCQDLSIAKKDRKWLDGERSWLFREYVRILKETKPKRFILENVASMPKEAKAIITAELWVEPIMFDAALVSAQSRKRLFRTNIPGVILPADKEIMTESIIIKQRNGEFATSCSKKERMFKATKKFQTITASYYKWIRADGRPAVSISESTLDLNRWDHRMLIPIECERLQWLPDQYSAWISNAQRYKCLWNAFNVDVIAHILSFIPKK